MPKVLKCAWAPSVTTADEMLKASRLSSIRRTWSSRASSPIADDQGVVDLIGLGALGGDIAFHQRRAGVLAEPQQRAREHRRRRGAAGDMNDMQRLRQHGAVGDLDHDAIGHHRAVERHHRIGVVGREQLRLQRGVAGFQHLAQRADARPFSRSPSIGQFWREHAIHQHQPAHAFDGVQLQGGCRRASAPPHPAQPPAAALRASARADRCISSPRSADAAGRRAHRPRTPAGAHRRPCRRPAAGRARSAKLSLSARPVSVFANSNVHHKIRISRQAASSNWA